MGFLGGLQWGYNWQVGGLLIGLEGDWNWSRGKDTVTYISPQQLATLSPQANVGFGFVGGQSWTSEEKIDWVTTGRARLGWARDCYLWYITGGVAWGKIENNYVLAANPGFSAPGLTSGVIGIPGGGAAASFSRTKAGWVAGGGVETDIGALF